MIEHIPAIVENSFLYLHSANTNSDEIKPFIPKIVQDLPNTYIWAGDGPVSGSPLVNDGTFYGYAEKHPIPRFFFDTFGTSAVFLPIKLILACLVIYLIDISFREELKDYPNLRGLIKVVIIVLGLAPGTRDMLRTMMGI